MAITTEKLFGVHATALKTYSNRNRVLASNIANADTPNYKARDVDFKQVLKQATGGTSTLHRTHARHMDTSPNGAARPGDLLYRVPHQPSLDGNTVESDVEQAQFAENAMRYQASVMLIDRRIKGLVSAIKGGR
ncbi:MAG: flagellar basal body rod protein FlgB [Pseudomonadota bacterium]